MMRQSGRCVILQNTGAVQYLGADILYLKASWHHDAAWSDHLIMSYAITLSVCAFCVVQLQHVPDIASLGINPDQYKGSGEQPSEERAQKHEHVASLYNQV